VENQVHQIFINKETWMNNTGYVPGSMTLLIL
jgi:hypothetical protein